MAKEAVFTMKLKPELRGYIQRQREAREYSSFLRDKVADARAQVAEGDYASAADVEARAAVRRTKLRAKTRRGGK